MRMRLPQQASEGGGVVDGAHKVVCLARDRPSYLIGSEHSAAIDYEPLLVILIV